MKIEDIRLTPEEIRAAHSYWNDISDNAVKRVKVVTDTATQKATEKIGEWAIIEICNLEYVNEQLRNSVEGDEHYRRMMISCLNDFKIALKELVKK